MLVTIIVCGWALCLGTFYWRNFVVLDGEGWWWWKDNNKVVLLEEEDERGFIQTNFILNNGTGKFIESPQFPEYDNLIIQLFQNQSRISLKAFELIRVEATDPWKSRGASVLVQALGGELYVDRSTFTTWLPWDKLRMHHILGRLKVLLAGKRLPDFEFILNTHDCPLRDPKRGPIFSITFCTGINTIPIPQWFTWRDGYFTSWDQRMINANGVALTKDWVEKAPRAVFRGNVRPSVLQFNSTTKKLQFLNITQESYKSLGRTKLYVLGQAHPNLLDVGIYGRGLDESRKIIEMLDYNFLPPISMSEQSLKFKYVLYAEGACGWADRLKVLLVSGMLIFLQNTPCNEFFQLLLRPWEHYIPVAADFSDLIQRIEWAQSNDDTVQEIIYNATEFGLRLNSQSAWDYYLEQVVEAYAKLFDYQPHRRPNTQLFLKECRCPNQRDLRCLDHQSFQ